jgi:hypothetical protein
MELNQQPNPKNPPPRTNPIHNLLQYLRNFLAQVVVSFNFHYLVTCEPNAHLFPPWGEPRERIPKVETAAPRTTYKTQPHRPIPNVRCHPMTPDRARILTNCQTSQPLGTLPGLKYETVSHLPGAGRKS